MAPPKRTSKPSRPAARGEGKRETKAEGGKEPKGEAKGK